MGLPRLFGLCLALLSFSAVNIAQANYIYDPVSRSWLPTSTTVLAPPNSGSVFTSTAGIPPNPSVNNGAFTTTSGGSFGSSPVNGTTKRVPITINGTVTKPNVHNAVASRLLKGNLAGLALGYGIQELLNGVNWVINEGGQVTYIDKTTVPATSGGYATHNSISDVHPTPQDACRYAINCATFNRGCTYYPIPWSQVPASIGTCNNVPPIEDAPFGAIVPISPVCPAGTQATDMGCAELTNVPVPAQDLIDAIDTSYQAHPSDYPIIVSEPSMAPTESFVQPIPRLNFPSVQTTYTDLDTGQTTITETNIWHDYTIHNNGSSQPKIESQETEQTDTYKDGTQTSSSTKTTSSGVATGTALAPAPAPIELELPPFCAWAGIVCDWIGWTQEPLDDDLDLAALITDEDYERNYTISFGVNACPAPISINVIFLNQAVELSYEPACQLAIYAKPFVLISAYIFAIMITLGVVRNG